jgi:hypothetical protein
MFSSVVPPVLVAILATAAQAQVMGICTGEECDYCPNSLTTAGTGFPECVIYDRDTVLGGKEGDYEGEVSGSRDLYYDIEEVEEDNCRYM